MKLCEVMIDNEGQREFSVINVKIKIGQLNLR